MRHCRSHTPIVRNIRMMTRIPALVVGTGFGCRTHVPALRAAGFDVVGLVGADAPRTARRAEKGGIVARYTDIDYAIMRCCARVLSFVRSSQHFSAPTLAEMCRVSFGSRVVQKL